jgi:hypothetical protein
LSAVDLEKGLECFTQNFLENCSALFKKSAQKWELFEKVRKNGSCLKNCAKMGAV